MNFISMVKLPFFQKGESKGIHFSSENNQLSETVFFVYISIIFFLIIILFLRLFQLTIVKGGYYRSLSEQNRIREITIEAPRGEIVDRKGFIIAKNLSPNVNVEIDQEFLKNNQRISSQRIYQGPEAISSLIGYRQIADDNDLKNDRCQYKLKLGDLTGKKGIEKLFDCQLRGQPGKKLIEIDAKDKYLRTINVIPPQPGDKIQLSLDLDLQKKSYELIKDLPAGRQVKKAAVIAINPKTGEILTSVSTPSFNSQDFEDQINLNVQKYLVDKDSPLFNRVTEGVYPPGSLFKLVVATAGLEEKIIDEKTQIEDTGTIKAGPLTFGNWYFLQYGKTEGMVDIIKAIKRSNDIFFYKVGEKTGEDKIKKWADIFGLGKHTGIGIDEVEGTIPSSFWKKEVLKENWYLGDTYNLSIGQGYVETTPLQTVLVTGVFANGGYLCQPQLLKVQSAIRQPTDKDQKCKKLPISQKTLSLIREGMKQACSTGGTGWPLFDFKIQTGCKTGTAESHAKSGMPHAWITVFAPFDNPEIALTVLVEEGGQGSDVAGPIAKEILKAYFERNQ
ncbi:MAG: penicillin-binding transpeptidase domain-containing protein [Candidatus Roizmanbacteria bacterium]|nr:penicillin-binding transpeptidase domain-containing protein [Candidatus Roizmanbacteria bacterium]